MFGADFFIPTLAHLAVSAYLKTHTNQVKEEQRQPFFVWFEITLSHATKAVPTL